MEDLRNVRLSIDIDTSRTIFRYGYLVHIIVDKNFNCSHFLKLSLNFILQIFWSTPKPLWQSVSIEYKQWKDFWRALSVGWRDITHAPFLKSWPNLTLLGVFSGCLGWWVGGLGNDKEVRANSKLTFLILLCYFSVNLVPSIRIDSTKGICSQ